ncbi:MAG: 50S ribosomal protein L21 [Firmicutes bacterium]|nr:50S ribosomal protein L21 [Bacillota bacterium]
MFAIIESGGKQYKVAEGDTIRVELLPGCEAEQEIEIDKVLAVYDGEMLTPGHPYVESAKVTCKVVENGKGKKVVVFHYKPKKNIRKKNGHRQPFTKLQVVSIQA